MMEWDDAKDELRELLGGDMIGEIEFATWYPEVFWLWKYHKRTMDDLQGLVGGSKRRK